MVQSDWLQDMSRNLPTKPAHSKIPSKFNVADEYGKVRLLPVSTVFSKCHHLHALLNLKCLLT